MTIGRAPTWTIMNTENTPQITDENGDALSSDDLADLLSTADKVEFPFEKLRRGKVVKRAQITIDVDTDGIESKDIATYRRALAERSVERDDLIAEAKKLGILDEDGVQTGSKSSESPRILTRIGELNDAFERIVAELVCKMVTSAPIAGKDLSNPDVLTEREGIGPVAREALFEYFFGDLSEVEVETGNSETANIENASATSEATETKEAAPATS